MSDFRLAEIADEIRGLREDLKATIEVLAPRVSCLRCGDVIPKTRAVRGVDGDGQVFYYCAVCMPQLVPSS